MAHDQPSFIQRMKDFWTPTVRAGFDAGNDPDRSSAIDLSCWLPPTQAADADIIPSKDLLEGRITDLSHNDGYISGAIDHHINHVVGEGLRLNLRPDFAAIGQTREWAREFASTTEAAFRTWAWSDENNVDVNGRFGWDALQVQAYRSFMTHGEILASIEFKRSRSGFGTCVRIIDPSRLCDPKDDLRTKDKDIRGGVELNSKGSPVAYWIANRHPRDYKPGRVRRPDKLTWKRVPIFGRNGRRKIIHEFDPMRPEQTRGYTMFAPVIKAMKMIDKVSDATLKSALIQTLFSIVIKSELDWDKAMSVLGGTEVSDVSDVLMSYMKDRGEYYSKHKIAMDDIKATHLLPNEELELKTPGGINPDIGQFFNAMRQEGARGAGMSTEMFTGDYSEASYSSSRMSNIENNRGHAGRRKRIMAPFCQAIFVAWLEEYLILNPGTLPGSLTFRESRGAIARSNWIGPPMVDSDPVKSATAAQIRLESNTTTYAHEAAQVGMDWEEMLEQRATELVMMRDNGIIDIQREASSPLPKEEPDNSQGSDT